MTDRDKNFDVADKEYEELVMEIKKELPNIVLPTLGLNDDGSFVNIDGKEFVISNKEV